MQGLRSPQTSDTRSPTSPDVGFPEYLVRLFFGNVKMTEIIFKPGHHTPPHIFVGDQLYMLTGSVYKGQPLIQNNSRKRELAEALLTSSELYHWKAIAWVVMDNHYHVILESPLNDPGSLSKFVASYHKFTARRWNAEDKSVGRKVWWNYWDTCIRSIEDYLNRLRYVFWNPVKHGLIQDPAEYPYSNYMDFIEKEWFDVGKAPIEVEDVPEF